MQLTISPAQVVSRVLAVLVLAVPLVYLGMAIDQSEQAMFGTLSHQELLAYLREGQTESFAGQYLYILVVMLVFLGIVEAVAFVLRLGMGLFRPGGVPTPARAVGY